jgi:hypothetical protein
LAISAVRGFLDAVARHSKSFHHKHYVMAQGGVTLSDFAYSRPRQFTCLFYQTFVPPFTNPTANPATKCPMP